MNALHADICRWERELADLQAEGAAPIHLAKIAALLETLYLKAL